MLFRYPLYKNKILHPITILAFGPRPLHISKEQYQRKNNTKEGTIPRKDQYLADMYQYHGRNNADDNIKQISKTRMEQYQTNINTKEGSILGRYQY